MLYGGSNVHDQQGNSNNPVSRVGDRLHNRRLRPHNREILMARYNYQVYDHSKVSSSVYDFEYRGPAQAYADRLNSTIGGDWRVRDWT